MEKLISEAGSSSQKTLKILDDGVAVLIESVSHHVVETPVFTQRTFLSKREQLNLYQALGEVINPQKG